MKHLGLQINENGGNLSVQIRAVDLASGGGIVSVNAGNAIYWSGRFIVINGGNGVNTSTSGYFDITAPAAGAVIPGLGGAASITVQAGGFIPMTAWTTLYYILPLGQSNVSLPGNFRVVAYTAAAEIPEHWVPICQLNGDAYSFSWLGGRYLLKAGDSLDTTVLRTGLLSTLNGGPLGGFRNLIINGNFSINQRAYASGGSLALYAYGHDRWKNNSGGASSYTFTQASLTENTTSHTIDTTITLPSGAVFQQIIEASNFEGGTYTLSWAGTATASITYYNGSTTITLLSNGVSGRSVSIPAGVTATVNFYGPGTVGLVQLERGTLATPFERRSRADELRFCQRFYLAIIAPYSSFFNFTGYFLATAYGSFNFNFPVPMRAVPSPSFQGTWTLTNMSSPGINVSDTFFTIYYQNTATGMSYYSCPAGLCLTFSAEL